MALIIFTVINYSHLVSAWVLGIRIKLCDQSAALQFIESLLFLFQFHRHLQELMMGLILDYVAEDSQDLASDVMENFMRGVSLLFSPFE